MKTSLSLANTSRALALALALSLATDVPASSISRIPIGLSGVKGTSFLLAGQSSDWGLWVLDDSIHVATGGGPRPGIRGWHSFSLRTTYNGLDFFQDDSSPVGDVLTQPIWAINGQLFRLREIGAPYLGDPFRRPPSMGNLAWELGVSNDLVRWKSVRTFPFAGPIEFTGPVPANTARSYGLDGLYSLTGGSNRRAMSEQGVIAFVGRDGRGVAELGREDGSWQAIFEYDGEVVNAAIANGFLVMEHSIGNFSVRRAGGDWAVVKPFVPETRPPVNPDVLQFTQFSAKGSYFYYGYQSIGLNPSRLESPDEPVYITSVDHAWWSTDGIAWYDFFPNDPDAYHPALSLDADGGAVRAEYRRPEGYGAGVLRIYDRGNRILAEAEIPHLTHLVRFRGAFLAFDGEGSVWRYAPSDPPVNKPFAAVLEEMVADYGDLSDWSFEVEVDGVFGYVGAADALDGLRARDFPLVPTFWGYHPDFGYTHLGGYPSLHSEEYGKHTALPQVEFRAGSELAVLSLVELPGRQDAVFVWITRDFTPFVWNLSDEAWIWVDTGPNRSRDWWQLVEDGNWVRIRPMGSESIGSHGDRERAGNGLSGDVLGALVESEAPSAEILNRPLIDWHPSLRERLSYWSVEIFSESGREFVSPAEATALVAQGEAVTTGRVRSNIYGPCDVTGFPWVLSDVLGPHAFFPGTTFDWRTGYPSAYIWTVNLGWLSTSQASFPTLSALELGASSIVVVNTEASDTWTYYDAPRNAWVPLP